MSSNKAKSPSKKRPYPMEVNDEMIRDHDIKPEEIIRYKRGNRWIRAAMVPVPEEVYEVLMRSDWAKDKRQVRESRCLIPGKNGKLRRCPEQIPNPDPNGKTKTIANKCENCKFYPLVCRESNRPASLEFLVENGFEPATTESMEEAIAWQIILEELITYLSSIKSKYGQIMRLLYDNTAQTEIARILGIPQRTISDDVKKVRKLSADYLQKNDVL